MSRSVRTALLACCLGGCSLFGGGGGRRGQSTPQPQTPSHGNYTLHNACAQPVEVCWGTKERCATVAPGERRKLNGPGAGLPVRLKAVDASVTADVTFSAVEVSASCKDLARLLPERAPE